MTNVNTEIIVQDQTNGRRLFGGVIKEVTKKFYLKAGWFEDCLAQDYTRLIDNVEDGISDVFSSQTEKAILTTLFANYASEIHIGSDVITGDTVSITFENSGLRNALDSLAKLQDRVWYVDYQKNFHYFNVGDEAAPFNVSDASDEITTFRMGNFEFTEDMVTDKTRGSFTCYEAGLFSGMTIQITNSKVGWTAREFLIYEIGVTAIAFENSLIKVLYKVNFGALPDRVTTTINEIDEETSDISLGGAVPIYDEHLSNDAGLPATNAPARSTVTGTNFAYEVLDFDHTTEETAYWTGFVSPAYQDQDIFIDIFWISAAASGDAKFGVSVLGRESGETWDAAVGDEQTVVSTTTGANLVNRSRISSFWPSWAAKDDYVLKLARKAGDVLDTINADDVRVLKVVLHYGTSFSSCFNPLPSIVEITPATPDSWEEVDLSDYAVPAGATAIWVHLESSGVLARVGLRMKGSTDDRTQDLDSASHTWAMVGLDADRKCEIWADNNMKVWLVGYTGSCVQMFTNGYDITNLLDNTWTEKDVSAQCPNAVAVIVEYEVTGGSNPGLGLRKNGSTDTETHNVTDHYWQIVGLDGSQIFEHFAADVTFDKLYLIGYIKSGVVCPLNPPSKVLSALSTWEVQDWSVEAPPARILFIRWGAGVSGKSYGLRKNGSSENITRDGIFGFGFGIVECDAAQKIEAWAEHTSYKTFKLIGFA